MGNDGLRFTPPILLQLHAIQLNAGLAIRCSTIGCVARYIIDLSEQTGINVIPAKAGIP